MVGSESKYSRRTYLKSAAAASAAGMAGLAGCTGGSGSGGGGGNGSGGSGGNSSSGNGSSGGNSSNSGSGGSSSMGTLTVLHGWTGGDGKKAVNNLIKTFKKEHPDVKTNFQPIGGGGNTNLDTAISNRAQNNNLPSSWADWPGKNLVQFTEAGLLGDISKDVWTKDLRNNYSKTASKYSQVGAKPDSIGKGPYVCVPIGSHRMNDLFYNVDVVKKAGVDPSSFSKPADLLAALKKVKKNTDAVPMAKGLKAPFTTLQLWEVTVQGQAGYQAFMDYVNGKGDKKVVHSAFEMVNKYYNYINDDASSIDFTEANDLIMNGKAAFMHNGNWVAGSYRNKKNFDYGKDWDNVSFPGTDDMYTMHLDSFPFPADGPAPEAAKTWLSFVGTTKAQVAYNQYKGSIPPRTDVSTDAFGPYLTETIKDYNKAKKKPPIIAHGLAVIPSVHSDIDGVITDDFLGSGNLDKATQGMLDAVSNSK